MIIYHLSFLQMFNLFEMEYDSVPDKFIQVEKVICTLIWLLKKLDIFIWDGEVHLILVLIYSYKYLCAPLRTREPYGSLFFEFPIYVKWSSIFF